MKKKISLGKALRLAEGRYRSPYPDGLPGHARGSDTSREAAINVLPRAGALQQQVYNFIVSCGEHGATVFEVMDGIGNDCKDSVAPRITELKEAKRVVDSGMRRRSPRKRKNRVTVWRAV
jgi:hypothetical protein